MPDLQEGPNDYDSLRDGVSQFIKFLLTQHFTKFSDF